MLILLIAACISFCSLLIGASIFLKSFWQKKETHKKLIFIKTNIVLYMMLDFANIVGFVCLYRKGASKTVGYFLLPLSQISAINIYILINNFSIQTFYTYIKFDWFYFSMVFTLQLILTMTILIVQLTMYVTDYYVFVKVSKVLHMALVTIQTGYMAFFLLKVIYKLKKMKKPTTHQYKYGLKGNNEYNTTTTILKQNLVFFAYCVNITANLVAAIKHLTFEKVDFGMLNLLIIFLCVATYINQYLFYTYFDETSRLIKNRKILKEELTNPSFLKSSLQTLHNWNLQHIALTIQFYSNNVKYKQGLRHTIGCIKKIYTKKPYNETDPFTNIFTPNNVDSTQKNSFINQLRSFSRLLEQLEKNIIKTKQSFDGFSSREKYITNIKAIMDKNKQKYSKKLLEFYTYIHNGGHYTNTKNKRIKLNYNNCKKTNSKTKNWKIICLNYYKMQFCYVKSVNKGIFRVLEEDSYIKNFVSDI